MGITAADKTAGLTVNIDDVVVANGYIGQ